MSNTNTSATGGYLLPTANPVYPNSLTFLQFMQTVMVGISGFDGTLVRPRWQLNVPKQPLATTDWMSFDIRAGDNDFNAFTGNDSSGNAQFVTQQNVEIFVAMYGPNSFDNSTAFANGFQISQNREAMGSNGVGFTNVSRSTHAPELVNEIFYDRYDFTIYLKRQVNRTYSIMNFVSMSGTLIAYDGTEEFIGQWVSQEGS